MTIAKRMRVGARRWIGLALLTGLSVAAVPQPGRAQSSGSDTPSLREACLPDVRLHCRPQLRSGDRHAMRACLADHLAQLGAPCRTVLRTRRGDPSPPEGTGTVHGYAGTDPARTLRYVPGACPSERPPLVVFVHGGGWSVGDKDAGAARKPAFFAGEGFAFATVDYRLHPEVSVETSTQDVADAIGWLAVRADRLGFDLTRIVLQGHSAGAHLAALVALDPRYLAAAGVDIGAIAAVSLLDGAAYDIARQIETGGNGGLFRDVFGSDPAEWQTMSPISHVSDSPSDAVFILHHVAGRRAAAEQARALADRLGATGFDAILRVAPGTDHAGINRNFGRPGDGPTDDVMQVLRSNGLTCR